MKSRYNLMNIFASIDITKFYHFAATISFNSKIILVLFKSPTDGFQLLSKFESFDKDNASSVLRIIPVDYSGAWNGIYMCRPMGGIFKKSRYG